MQFPLVSDIRTCESSIAISEKIFKYSVNFVKNQLRISIEKVQGDHIYLRAPVRTSSEEIEHEIRIFVDKIHHKDDGNQCIIPEAIVSSTINIRDINIPYSSKINRRRKSPFIFMLPDGRIEVEVPHQTSEQEILQILQNEKEWLYREFYKTRPECPPETEDRTVRIHDKDIPYLIRRNDRTKKITLRILGNGAVEVSAPYHASSDSITAFVERQTAWIAPRIDLTLEEKLPPHCNADGDIRENPDVHAHILHEGHIIPYHIKRSTRAKRITIQINRLREVVIVAPHRTPVSEIEYLARQKADWIYKHTILSERPLPPKREFRDGEMFPFLGDTFTVRIIKGEQSHYKKIDHDLVITVPKNFNEFNEKSLVKQAISAFLSEVLYQFSLPFVNSYAQKLQITVPPVKIRDQKTKWGTCTPHSIVLNLRLCMAPTSIIEYVIVHELAHKINPDHSPRFWKTVEDLMPDFQERRDYMKKNGHFWVL